VLQNLAPFPRREGAAVVVPFAPGAAREGLALHVTNAATVWQPFGLHWPDGSWRQALCLFHAEVPALGEVALALADGAGPEPTGGSGEIAMPEAFLELVATVGGTTVRTAPQRVHDLEANAARRVELRRARLGDTGLVAEVAITAWRGQPHAHVELAVFFSDPRLPAMQCDVRELAVETRGMALVLRHAGRLGIAQATTTLGSRCVLLANSTLGDGQGLRRVGALVPQLRGDRGLGDATVMAACTAPLLGATTWQASGAFGAFGRVPELPAWLRGPRLRAHLAARHRAFVAGDRPPGDPFGTWLGAARYAGQTGDQDDFGVVKLGLVAATGLPSLLLEAEASLLQEACRPVHFFEADGAPVDPAAHPDWVVWSGRTHWHDGVSKDRLGKPAPEPPFDSHGWTGRDREHWSVNTLGAYALLTGAHWARSELANDARLYRAGQTLEPDRSTSFAGAPRGVGRTALAATWMLLATGDEALRARMDARVDQVEWPQFAGRELAPNRVRPMAVNDPDARMLGGQARYWNPWQDATAAIGMAALHRVTGNANARTLAEALATNVVRHGWLLTAQRNEVMTALRWLDGEPLTDEQWRAADPAWIQDSANTAFTEWAFAAVEIARGAAARDGDAALQQRCEEIQRRVRGSRRPPPDGGLDRLAEWDVVVWP
jgi:hypothetical protein